MRYHDDVEPEHKRGGNSRRRGPRKLGEHLQHLDGVSVSAEGRTYEYTLTREEYARINDKAEDA